MVPIPTSAAPPVDQNTPAIELHGNGNRNADENQVPQVTILSEKLKEYERELAALRAQLATLIGKDKEATTPPAERTLFTSQEAIDHAKTVSATGKDEGKKVILPKVIPGFKASSLEIGKSTLSFLFHLHYIYFLSFIHPATLFGHITFSLSHLQH